jgi:hypothetical protein
VAELNDEQLEKLYDEAAEHDRALANAGMADYARILAEQDDKE